MYCIIFNFFYVACVNAVSGASKNSSSSSTKTLTSWQVFVFVVYFKQSDYLLVYLVIIFAHFQIAVYGKNFCASAKNAFLLLMRNIVRWGVLHYVLKKNNIKSLIFISSEYFLPFLCRVVVLDKVTDFLLFIGKMVIVASTGKLSFS